jgi:post-segregation antitoxin (ccd killing protein)
MRIVVRMPRVQVYLPDDLHDELKRRRLSASELLQIALRAELERQDALDAMTTYLAELASEVAEPSKRQQARADAIARRVRARGLSQAG